MISTPEEFLTVLPIPDTDLVYRQGHLIKLIKIQGDKKKRFPDETNFVPDPDGLSLHWSAYSTPEYVFKHIGISYKFNSTTYKTYSEFRVFSIPVALFRSLDGVRVEHTPVYNGNPAPLGVPNNYAHASALYSAEDVEIRLKLSDYCRENYDKSHCSIDFKLLDPIIEDLRERLDQTNYHRLPHQQEQDQIQL